MFALSVQLPPTIKEALALCPAATAVGGVFRLKIRSIRALPTFAENVLIGAKRSEYHARPPRLFPQSRRQ
jgi:hypothetical protein